MIFRWLNRVFATEAIDPESIRSLVKSNTLKNDVSFSACRSALGPSIKDVCTKLRKIDPFPPLSVRTRHKFRKIRSFLRQKVRTSASEEPLCRLVRTGQVPLECGRTLWTATDFILEELDRRSLTLFDTSLRCLLVTATWHYKAEKLEELSIRKLPGLIKTELRIKQRW